MLHKNEIGVCVDKDIAYLLEEKNDENLITIIKADDPGDSEPAKHTDGLRPKKRPRKNDFYRKVFEMIRDFDKVSLFGPASAKKEIIRLLAANQVSKIAIEESEDEEEVTENQKIDFINRYFDEKS